MKALKLIVITALAAATALTAGVTTSCDVLKRQAQGAYNMVKCDYSFQSLTHIQVAGIDLSRGLSIMDTPKILGLLSGGTSSIPVGLTVNLAVKNPNATEAMLSGMDYTLSIDGIEFTRGAVTQKLSVAPGATGTLPLAMAFDVATLMRGDSRDAVTGVVKNLIGTGGEASTVRLDIRPTFDVAGHMIASPVPIPVSFTFGGAK
ncbi:MAG: LEA type 2 family protein [Alistipes sp.]|jgi:LEA14-like dessication related protein|nr:LEA type 2 family protein [Alistipes sp.]